MGTAAAKTAVDLVKNENVLNKISWCDGDAISFCWTETKSGGNVC